MEFIRNFSAVILIILLTASITFSLLDMLGPAPELQDRAIIAAR